MAETLCFSSVRLKRLRVTQLDDCGALAENALYVASKGWVTLTVEQQRETATPMVAVDGNGDLVINDRTQDTLTHLTVAASGLIADPDFINLVSGFPLEVETLGDTVGYRVKTGKLDANFALEGWGDITPSTCEEGHKCYLYVLVPWVTNASIAHSVIQNGALNFDMVGGFTEEGSEWGVGPWAVVGDPDLPTALESAITTNQIQVVRRTCVGPPDDACGALPVDSV